ncbi:heat shock factor protein 2 isoform X2 [Lepisosteus oculatus]|uniref:heat shock factor protein 2 isoform X2 n=1 Tax=Lepisosteus oculatus TaxID=7918 RepID=UPI00073FF3D3|nr:PREDICTED: heat shock factor protein 2 isoform X1 [Lepisosteus oculatus]
MKQNSSVPAFLTKLWTLVEDPDTNEFICWSQEGNSFLVLDEQRFAKEILPKFFKHNNMASFVRQLNMYGFRKVMHMDTGIVKQERDGPVEFQHPFFKHGQDDLLENIKRKVSSARPEENKIRHEDLSKILSNVQSVHGKQESLDSRLSTLKRENEALWREVSDLRQKHTSQQQVIKKLIQFIITLAQNNRLVSLKRKRPLLMNSNGNKSKYFHQIYEESVEHSKGSMKVPNGLKNSSDISDDVIICDVTDDHPENVEEVTKISDPMDVEIVEVKIGSDGAVLVDDEVTDPPRVEPQDIAKAISENAPFSSSALQINKPSALTLEDPVTMMDSIMNESGAISQNINLLGKVELMDYLDSIDCSLEDFQAMLCGKQFNIDPEIVDDLFNPVCLVSTNDHSVSTAKGTESSKEKAGLLSKEKPSESNNDKQLIQYTSCPLLAFLDGCSSTLTPEPDAPVSGLNESLLEQEQDQEDPTDLLETDEPPRSKLIRLEPLTEAEASEATLFYFCGLNSETPDIETPQLGV